MHDMFPPPLMISKCVFPFISKQHMADMFTSLWTLSECVLPYHEQHSTIMVDMFPPLSIIRKCIVPFHEQHHHSWHVSATFDFQEVRISIPCIAPSQLTCSRHYWPSVGVYVQFISSTVMADMFPSLLIIRKCVFQFQELHCTITVDVPASFESQLVHISILWAAQSCLTCSCHSYAVHI